MKIQKEAEQLYCEILSNGVNVNIEFDDPVEVRKQMVKQGVDLILSSFERVSREAWDECSYTCACLEDAHTRMVEPKYYENFDTYWQSLTNQDK